MKSREEIIQTIERLKGYHRYRENYKEISAKDIQNTTSIREVYRILQKVENNMQRKRVKTIVDTLEWVIQDEFVLELLIDENNKIVL